MNQSNTSLRAALKGSTAGAAMTLALVAVPAVAQEATTAAAAPSETIIVTGSRIARPNLDTSSPVTVIDEAEIGFRQPINTEEFLREIPGVVANIGSAVNNGANGSAQLDLRNLGPNRNLVLVDGRRLVPASNAGVVDLNTVPVALLERVDVFTGGAAAVYGADAVAGVVNFVTKRDFTGIDLTTTAGLAEKGDGFLFRTDLTIGANFDDGRGNVVMSIGYSNTDPVLQGDRPWGTEAISSSSGKPQGSSTAAPASIFLPGGLGFYRVSDDGQSLVPGAQNYNFNPLNVYQTPLERYSVFTKANYEISDAVEVYAVGQYIRSVIDQQIAPSGTFFSALSVPISNPFLSTQQRNIICQAYAISQADCDAAATVTDPANPAYRQVNNTQIGRRFVEAGPRRTNYTTNTFQLTAGAKGPLTNTLEWDIFATYGESERTNTSDGQGLRSRLQNALFATSTTTCRVGGDCVPINLFGPVGSITQEAVDYLNVSTFAFNTQKFTNVVGQVGGDIGWALPWAAEPVGVAFGAEYRKYKGASGGDGISAISGEVLGAGAPALPVTGEYDTTEFFGEIIVPIVENRPGFENLTLEGSVRYSDYSTSGGNWAYSVGGSWTPVNGFKIRGNYARAVRAPNLDELFQPQIVFLTNRPTDPCQQGIINATTTPLCAAQLSAVGAPAGLISQIPAPTAGQINAFGGGNPDLNVEKADTYTIGAVLTPAAVPGLAVTVDYYNIVVNDAISAPSQADIIDSCFDGSIPANCALIRRNPVTGGLSGPNDTTFGPFLALSNLGRLKTSGIDFGVAYRVDAGFATLAFNLLGNYTIESRFQATPTSVDRECVGFYSVACGSLLPEWSFNFRTTASFPTGTDVSLRWRYLSAMEVEPGTEGSVFDPFERMNAYSLFDLALSQKIEENFRVTLSVDNLFNRVPPEVGNTVGITAYNSGNTFPSTYDAIGRRYRVGVNLRF